MISLQIRASLKNLCGLSSTEKLLMNGSNYIKYRKFNDICNL